jgi:hypothetical protein
MQGGTLRRMAARENNPAYGPLADTQTQSTWLTNGQCTFSLSAGTHVRTMCHPTARLWKQPKHIDDTSRCDCNHHRTYQKQSQPRELVPETCVRLCAWATESQGQEDAFIYVHISKCVHVTWLAPPVRFRSTAAHGGDGGWSEKRRVHTSHVHPGKQKMRHVAG